MKLDAFKSRDLLCGPLVAGRSCVVDDVGKLRRAVVVSVKEDMTTVVVSLVDRSRRRLEVRWTHVYATCPDLCVDPPRCFPVSTESTDTVQLPLPAKLSAAQWLMKCIDDGLLRSILP